MRIKIKQLLCAHRWEPLYKPVKDKSIQRCVKCEKVQFRKESVMKTMPGTYCWCLYCSYNLVRDSYVIEDILGLVSYNCKKL